MENQYDPLGIHSLIEKLHAAHEQLDKLEQFVLHGVELPVSEKMITEKTGIKSSALLSLRQSGKLRSYKVGKTVLYLPSEFTEDIRVLTPT